MRMRLRRQREREICSEEKSCGVGREGERENLSVS